MPRRKETRAASGAPVGSREPARDRRARSRRAKSVRMTRHEKKAWSIVGTHFMTLFFVLGSGYDTGSVFVPALVQHFGWSRVQLGVLFSALGVAMMVSAPVGGWLLERIQASIVVAVGAALVGSGFVVASRANSFAPMMMAFVMLGTGLGASCYVPAAMVLSNWFTANRGRALGIAMAGEPVGGMVMNLVAGYAILWFGWRVGYLIVAVPVFLIVVPLALLIIRAHPPVAVISDADATPHVLDGFEMSEALRSRSFWLIALAETCGGFYVTAVFVHLAAYVIGIGYSATTAAWAVSTVLGLGAIGQPLMGMVGDRTTGRTALALTYGITGLGLIVVLGARHGALLVAFISVFGFMLTAPVTLLPMVMLDSLGRKRFSSLVGIMGFFWALGLSCGPLVAGELFDLSGSYQISFEVCAAAAFLGALASLLCVPWDAGAGAEATARVATSPI